MFAWESQDQPGMDYSSGWWKESGWGFNDGRNGMKPGEVVPCIAGEDVEADARRLAANGAVFNAIMPVPDVGRIVHFGDSDGNHMAVIQPQMPDAGSSAEK